MEDDIWLDCRGSVVRIKVRQQQAGQESSRDEGLQEGRGLIFIGCSGSLGAGKEKWWSAGWPLMAITMRQFLVEKRKWRKGKRAPWTIINGHDDKRRYWWNGGEMEAALVEGERNGNNGRPLKTIDGDYGDGYYGRKGVKREGDKSWERKQKRHGVHARGATRRGQGPWSAGMAS
jgi:hypothetical protein